VIKVHEHHVLIDVMLSCSEAHFLRRKERSRYNTRLSPPIAKTRKSRQREEPRNYYYRMPPAGDRSQIGEQKENGTKTDINITLARRPFNQSS
jgi:hypothetical protein